MFSPQGDSTSSTAQLLDVEDAGHGGPGHEQHLNLRTVPALVQEIAGAEHLDLPADEPILKLLPLRPLHAARHRGSGDARLSEQLRDLLRVPHGGAEDHRPFILDVPEPGVHNEAVPLRDVDLALKVSDVVADTVEPHLGQVDVGVDSDTPHRHQLSQLHSGFQVQAVGGVLEGVQNALPVAPLRCGSEPQGKGGLEESQDLLVCIRRRVVCLVHDEVVKGILPEPGVTAEEHPKLVFHRLRLERHLPHGPAQVYHAVLLEEVIVEFPGGNQPLVVGSLVVDLNGHPAPLVLQHEVGVAAVLADVVEVYWE